MNANELAEIIQHLENAKYIGASKAATMLRQQQDEIEALKQVLQSIANEHIELSHDKIKWQCEDHIRWAKEALEAYRVPAMLRQQQAEIEALNQRIERMIENASHNEGIAHAGGFETGYQAGLKKAQEK